MSAILTHEFVPEHSDTSSRSWGHPIPAPAWWRGDADRYQELLALRSQIAALESVPVHLGRIAIISAAVGVVGIANAALAHAVAEAVTVGIDWEFVAFVFLLLIFLSLCGAEASLSRRGCSFALCNALWGKLVSAIKTGQVDANAINAWNPGETRIEKALHREVLTAIRYVAAAGALKPKLNLFAADVFGLAKVNDNNHRGGPRV